MGLEKIFLLVELSVWVLMNFLVIIIHSEVVMVAIQDMVDMEIHTDMVVMELASSKFYL